MSSRTTESALIAPVSLQTNSSKKATEPIRLELARSLNTWERQKEHFFLSAFIQVAEAFSRFYEGGLDIMQGMDSFVDDIKESRRQALSREVRFAPPCAHDFGSQLTCLVYRSSKALSALHHEDSAMHVCNQYV